MIKRKLLVRQDTECPHQASCCKICRPEEVELCDYPVVSRNLTGHCNSISQLS